MDQALLAALVAEVGLITWRDFSTGADRIGGLPLPADYLAALALFGAFGLLRGKAAPVGAALGWGFVVATLLNAGPLKALGVPVGKAGKGGAAAPQQPTSINAAAGKGA